MNIDAGIIFFFNKKLYFSFFFSSWEEEQQQEAYRQHLNALIEIETQYQLHEYGNDVYRIWHRVASASPRFIAQFRLAEPQIVNIDLLDKICSICRDDFEIGEHFAQWPCEGRHTFHFECMLGVLRALNTCPLCRHPVEAANLPGVQTAFRLSLAAIMPHLFT